jgi:hypothetical protein
MGSGCRIARGRAVFSQGLRNAVLGLLLVVVLAAATPAAADGTWVMAPPNPATNGQAFGLWLLTDGRVLSHGSALNHWVILTPDKTGSYAKGSWKNAAASVHARGGAQQHVLKDGRFFQIGGEYVDGPACTAALCVSGEIYDPVADKWTEITPAPYRVADTGTATLDDGRILIGCQNGKQTMIYDPDKDSWSEGGPGVLSNGDENAWSALQNGGILAVGYAKDGAAIYDQATGKWQRTGAVPAGFDTGDTGGISLMFDGRVFVYGLGQSYIYTPGATGADPGTWALGPKMLNGDRAEDEYSDTLPNGMVWGALVEKTYGPGVVLQQFDPSNDTVSSITPPPDTGNPYPIDYINLPNGQIMVTCERNDWIYTPDTQPKDEWRPSVTSVTYDSASKTYTLTGTQLSGLINGADEGDDMSMAENYPIVSLRDESGNVYYARSFNFSRMTPQKGDAPQTCQFTTPDALPQGSYDLYVSAVGVRSKDPVAFTVGMGGQGKPPATNAGLGGASASGTGGTAGGGSGAGAAGTGSGGTGSGSSQPGASTSGVGVGAGGAGAGGAGHAAKPAGASGSGSNASGTGAPSMTKSGCGCRIVEPSSASYAHAYLGLLAIAFARARRRRLG